MEFLFFIGILVAIFAGPDLLDMASQKIRRELKIRRGDN